jgi:hypothetical protein
MPVVWRADTADEPGVSRLQGQPGSGEAAFEEAGLVLDFLQAVPDDLEQAGVAGGFGWCHFAAASLRCQRSSVPGVTIRCARSGFGRVRAKAAITARSDQIIFGFGCARRRTATSCRSARISASLDAEVRASSTSQDSTVVSKR